MYAASPHNAVQKLNKHTMDTRENK